MQLKLLAAAILTGCAPIFAGEMTQSVIVPGQRAILAIPFEAQQRGGICAAAATINILTFLQPDLKIEQEKLFSLFDAGRSGASPQQVIQGIKTLGFTGTLIPLQGQNPEKLAGQIKASIDAGHPLIAASRSHAMVLFGYDDTQGKSGVFLVWDQRKAQNKRNLAGFPPGTEEISQSRFMTHIKSVMFIEKIR